VDRIELDQTEWQEVVPEGLSQLNLTTVTRTGETPSVLPT
jgi:hypothetical protein